MTEKDKVVLRMLRQVLVSEGIDQGDYCIGSMCPDSVCLVQVEGGWATFYVDREEGLLSYRVSDTPQKAAREFIFSMCEDSRDYERMMTELARRLRQRGLMH